MNRITERHLVPIARAIGAVYALICCWLPVIWLIREQRETYGLGLPWWDQVALPVLGLLALMGTSFLLFGHSRPSSRPGPRR